MGEYSGKPKQRGIGISPFHVQMLLSMAVYTLLCGYLYQPYLERFARSDYLSAAAMVIGSLGCFLMSRRWVGAYFGCLFAGALYGFNPLVLTFMSQSPSGALITMVLPWLFCPAVFFPRGKKKTLALNAVNLLLTVLPFAAIISLFYFGRGSSMEKYIPLMPVKAIEASDLRYLVNSLHFDPGDPVLSMYHIGLTAGLMGLFMYISARKTGIVLIIGISLCVSMLEPVLKVSPVVWALVPVLYLSIMAGLGMQGLAWSGPGDSKWVFVCILLSVILTVVNVAVEPSATGPWSQGGQMYVLGAVMLGSLFFMTRAGVRWHLLRWTILCGGLGVDIIITGRMLVDKMF